MVAHACNPSILQGWVGRITWAHDSQAAVSYDGTIELQLEWQSKAQLQNKETKKQNQTKQKKTWVSQW